MNEQKMDEAVKAWMNKTNTALKQKAKSLGIEHRSGSPSGSSSVEGIKATSTKNFGIVSKISFKFARHMIFVHKGVGKGTPISSAGQTARKAKEWFEPVLEDNIEELADIAADELGESITNNFKL
jgi:hypothetical protein